MSGLPEYPALYQINTRVRLRQLSAELGRTATLADFPERDLATMRDQGFNWVWLTGVWQTGAAGRRVSRSHQDWIDGYVETLGNDLRQEDICGSPFAITSYTAHKDLGGDAALAALRKRLGRQKLRLLLDFVPNHTALDHPWVNKHPEFYIRGKESDLKVTPENYYRPPRKRLVFAHGRDCYSSGWQDTLQLNYRHPGLRKAMLDELARIAEKCDGVRCDMAMLLLPDEIRRIWGEAPEIVGGSAAVEAPFWPEAIRHVRRQRGRKDFLFLAEVYWEKEWELQQQGFDYTSDKKLYDRLRDRNAAEVRGHLTADLDYQRKSVRFLENHDEKRAAAVFWPREVHQAAAIVTYLVPGMRHFHEGQLEGWRRKLSVHLSRRLPEPPDPVLQSFYNRLLTCMRRPEVCEGTWQLLDCVPSSDGNPSFDRFIAFTWEFKTKRLLVVVNYGSDKAQCHLPLRFAEPGGMYLLHDLMSCSHYERWGSELLSPGLYLDMEGWRFHVFEMSPCP